MSFTTIVFTEADAAYCKDLAVLLNQVLVSSRPVPLTWSQKEAACLANL